MASQYICQICGKNADIVRKFSGEYYCGRHFIEKLIKNPIKKSIRILKYKKSKTAIVGRYYHGYLNIIDNIRNYFEDTPIEIEIIENTSVNFFDESLKIINEYNEFLDKIKKGEAPISLKTADLLAHDYLILVIKKEFSLLREIHNNTDPNNFPLSKIFTHEIFKIYNLNPQIHLECSTYNFVREISEKRPTAIFGLLNYVKEVSVSESK